MCLNDASNVSPLKADSIEVNISRWTFLYVKNEQKSVFRWKIFPHCFQTQYITTKINDTALVHLAYRMSIQGQWLNSWDYFDIRERERERVCYSLFVIGHQQNKKCVYIQCHEWYHYRMRQFSADKLNSYRCLRCFLYVLKNFGKLFCFLVYFY